MQACDCGAGQELRNSVGVLQGPDAAQAVDHQHADDGGRQEPGQAGDDGRRLFPFRKDEKRVMRHLLFRRDRLLRRDRYRRSRHPLSRPSGCRRKAAR